MATRNPGFVIEYDGHYPAGYWGAGYWVRPAVTVEARLGTPATVATAQATVHSFVGLLGLDEAIGQFAVGKGA